MDRFLAKVATGPDCWLWTGSTGKNGYGVYWLGDGKWSSAHREAWRRAYGEIPDGLHVCHRCDVRNCVNPDHLFLGDRHVNMGDAATKGRLSTPKKLTAAQALAIYGDPRLYREIAADYGIGRHNVSYIKRGMTWAHVTRPPS